MLQPEVSYLRGPLELSQMMHGPHVQLSIISFKPLHVHSCQTGKSFYTADHSYSHRIAGSSQAIEMDKRVLMSAAAEMFCTLCSVPTGT